MIELRRIEKNYRRGAEDVRALRGVDLSVEKEELLAITGPSGAGKTTLLHILGCLDQPTQGEVLIDGINASRLPEAELVKLRRDKIGFVFQQFYLIPGLSVFDNIALPLLFSKKPATPEKITHLAEMVGLEHRLDHVPSQLSGGEMQRTAIARGLVNEPEILLADEPTGNLDSENSEKIFEILRSLRHNGLTIVMITHNPDLSARANRILHIRDGLVHTES
ncbi:MAG: ABC transporter ATP-binding protein [Desulfuromonadales bacterium]|jgi:ABC-type lipoprotein export system ATPase subunit|nr:ABC transporter ATP-binding protein [Desulfuromonadales bacterium]MDH3869092.1 ABC transporter ATP-binding protein [Desulfuromonadales bacterium]MDH3959912.1 ABC transporter ATP-binding protein [Desulfuromonadales bacterium]MDH4025935.1 ABC transporter ATP-binding protein [Desulfuromonadales bacterium]